MSGTVTHGFVVGIGGFEWLMILLFMVLPGVWVWRDTGRIYVPGGRLWGGVVLLTGPLGLAVYLLVRRWFGKVIALPTP